MQYVAAVSGKGQDIDRVKEQLLQSNPVLEGGFSCCQGFAMYMFHSNLDASATEFGGTKCKVVEGTYIEAEVAEHNTKDLFLLRLYKSYHKDRQKRVKKLTLVAFLVEGIKWNLSF